MDGTIEKEVVESSRAEYLARQIARLSGHEREQLGEHLRRFERAGREGDHLPGTAGAITGQAVAGGGLPLGAQELGLDNVDDAFTYQPWTWDQQERGDRVRELLVLTAKAILRNVPRSPLRTRALNALIDCRMLANAAISFGGRF